MDTPSIETGLMIYLIIYLLGFARTIHTLTKTIYMTLTWLSNRNSLSQLQRSFTQYEKYNQINI